MIVRTSERDLLSLSLSQCMCGKDEREILESYTHVGEEFLYILKGALQIFLHDKEYRLKTGDSFYFESAVPHKWTNPGRSETWILWVNTPPTF